MTLEEIYGRKNIHKIINEAIISHCIDEKYIKNRISELENEIKYLESFLKKIEKLNSKVTPSIKKIIKSQSEALNSGNVNIQFMKKSLSRELKQDLTLSEYLYIVTKNN